MSWSEGHYWYYGFKLKDEIIQKELDGQERLEFLEKRWKYVSEHCNTDKKEFMESMEAILKDYKKEVAKKRKKRRKQNGTVLVPGQS